MTDGQTDPILSQVSGGNPSRAGTGGIFPAATDSIPVIQTKRIFLHVSQLFFIISDTDCQRERELSDRVILDMEGRVLKTST